MQNIYKKLLFTLCGTAVLIFSRSDLQAQTEKIAFEKYGVEEGLPEEFVRHIVQDRQGFIWAATQNGLVKFDGYKMQVFRMNTKIPGAIPLRDQSGGLLLASDGHLWMAGVGEGAGIASFDPELEKFTKV